MKFLWSFRTIYFSSHDKLHQHQRMMWLMQMPNVHKVVIDNFIHTNIFKWIWFFIFSNYFVQFAFAWDQLSLFTVQISINNNQFSLTELPKTPVVMRKIIVRNPDGTTKLIQKKVVATGNTTQAPNSEPRSAPQKVQVIRRPDGTLQYQGLKPGTFLTHICNCVVC